MDGLTHLADDATMFVTKKDGSTYTTTAGELARADLASLPSEPAVKRHPDHMYPISPESTASARYIVRDKRTKETALVCQHCLVSVWMGSGRYAKYGQYASADALMPGVDACTICGFPLLPAEES